MVVAAVVCVSTNASGLAFRESEWNDPCKTMPPVIQDAPDPDNFARGYSLKAPLTVISYNCVTTAWHWTNYTLLNRTVILGTDYNNPDYKIVQEFKCAGDLGVFKVEKISDSHSVPFSKWMELYDGDVQIGQETLYSGYGPLRVVDDKDNLDWSFAETPVTYKHHWGKNLVTATRGGNPQIKFDRFGDPDYIEYEAGPYGGDSGTGQLIKDNNQWKLAYVGRVPTSSTADLIHNFIEEAAEIQNLTTRYFYDTIQEAINDASDGDVIELPQRTYTENIDFLGKAITLQSRDPNNPQVAAATIIEGMGTGDTVTFSTESGAGAALLGITITCSNGNGIYCLSASPTISNCIIRNCLNAGVYCNTARPIIRNCIINGCDNGIRSQRGSSPTISNCKIYDNFNRGVWCIRSATTIKNNWIYSNASGIKLEFEDTSEIENNTIVNNTDYGIEKGVRNPSPTISNCILWGNGDDSHEEFGASYCWFTSDGDPLFFDVDGKDDIGGNGDDDYRLASGSPCIDAGDPNYLPDAGEKDIDGGWRVMGDRIDIGAYEDELACFPSDHPDYDEWVSVGKPSCWCHKNQCYGDADNQMEGDPNSYYYVGYNDLAVLIAAWGVKEPPKGPGIDSITYNGIKGICADHDHNQAGHGKGGFYRVAASDINILAANWNILEPPDGPGLAADCPN
jgi:parallel beta-helix repeat protein